MTFKYIITDYNPFITATTKLLKYGKQKKERKEFFSEYELKEAKKTKLTVGEAHVKRSRVIIVFIESNAKGKKFVAETGSRC